MSLMDTASEVREGEQLDVEKINAYLKTVINGLEGNAQVKQFPGGASNLTYLLRYQNRDLVLRRPPFGRIAKSAHNMNREAFILQTLKPVYPYVPEVLHNCQDHAVMGCDFFVMERLEGFIPRRDFPPELALGPEKTRELCINGLDALLALHQVDVNSEALQSLGKGAGYVERQISGWSDRYTKALTDDAASFAEVMSWLRSHMPADIKSCVIHNDFRFDNLVYSPANPTQVIGVLDWEMATLGDPLMDLGNSLAYWVQADDPAPVLASRLQPTHLPGMLTREEVVDYYLAKTGLAVNSFDFYEIYGLFRLAAIVQQIYYRYYHGQTQDKRFATFGQFAALLEQRCLALIG